MNNNYIDQLQEQIIEKFINSRLKPEKDDDGQIIYPSLESIIEDTINNYLEGYPESEYDIMYNKIYRKLSNRLDEKEILENMSIGQDWYGLSVAERNSGRY